jgi:hypothetical protein
MSKYAEEKARVRADVIAKLDELFFPGQSWGCLADIQDKLYKLAKKYGLVKEFKENGII